MAPDGCRIWSGLRSRDLIRCGARRRLVRSRRRDSEVKVCRALATRRSNRNILTDSVCPRQIAMEASANRPGLRRLTGPPRTPSGAARCGSPSPITGSTSRSHPWPERPATKRTPAASASASAASKISCPSLGAITTRPSSRQRPGERRELHALPRRRSRDVGPRVDVRAGGGRHHGQRAAHRRAEQDHPLGAVLLAGQVDRGGHLVERVGVLLGGAHRLPVAARVDEQGGEAGLRRGGRPAAPAAEAADLRQQDRHRSLVAGPIRAASISPPLRRQRDGLERGVLGHGGQAALAQRRRRVGRRSSTPSASRATPAATVRCPRMPARRAWDRCERCGSAPPAPPRCAVRIARWRSARASQPGQPTRR